MKTKPNPTTEPLPKPPLGLMPRGIWLEFRFIDVCAAVARYGEAKIAIPMDWIDELRDLAQEIRDARIPF